MVKNPRTPRRDEPLAYSVEQAANVMGLSKSSVYKLINRGRLVARKLDARTVITRFDAEVFLRSLPVVAPSEAPAVEEPAADQPKLSPLDQMVADQIALERAAIYGGKPPLSQQTALDEVLALSMTSRHKPANTNAPLAGEDI